MALWFADIEGSTELLRNLGDSYVDLLATYHLLLDSTVRTVGGSTISTEGDGHFARFPDVPSAVRAAVGTARAVDAQQWPGGTTLALRVGLHVGSVVEADGELVGMAIHEAARIAAAANGGQVLMSQAVLDAMTERWPAGVSVHDLGHYRLRGIPEPVHIHQLAVEGVADRDEPLRSRLARNDNLPRPVTSFVGRERELAALHTLVAQHRLVTLTGPGGSGKSRLATRYGADVVNQFPDGVWLIDLAPIGAPDLVTAEIAAVLGVRERTGTSVVDDLVEHLEDHTVLLIVDNAERFAGELATLIAMLLDRCPGVVVMATSRVPLHVAGELLFAVPPLDGDQRSAMTASPSERLFADRAALVSAGFELDEETTPLVREICARLDHLPLAIELAASRLSVLSLDQLARRLDDRFRVLTGGAATAAAHHRTLTATMDWSHDLLGEAERILLRRLAVFSGPFDLDAAELVCSGSGLDDVLSPLGALVEASLVMRQDDRYSLLQSVREYADAKLTESDERSEVELAHFDVYLARVAGGGADLDARAFAEWRERVHRDVDNLRVALSRALSRSDAYRAVALAGSMARYWYRSSLLEEARRWFSEVLALPDTAPSMELDTVLRFAAGLAYDRGERERATELLRRETEVAQTIGDPGTLARSYNIRAGLTWRAGDLARADDLYDEALRHAEDGPFADQVRINRAQVLIGMGRHDAAEALLAGMPPGATPDVERVRALIAYGRGDVGAAASHAEQCLELALGLGVPLTVATAQLELGRVELRRGHLARAADLADAAANAFSDMADHGNHAESALVAAEARLRAGDAAGAADIQPHLARLVEDRHDERLAVVGVPVAALAERLDGRPAMSARLHGVVDALLERTGSVLPSPDGAVRDQELLELRSELGPGELERLRKEWAADPDGALAGLVTGDASRVG